MRNTSVNVANDCLLLRQRGRGVALTNFQLSHLESLADARYHATITPYSTVDALNVNTSSVNALSVNALSVNTLNVNKPSVNALSVNALSVNITC